MGYQESYVTTKKKKDFEGLVNYIKSIGNDFYEGYGAYPVEIITFADNSSMHPKLKKGSKAIYFTGERYPQSNKARILGYMADDDDYNSEEQKLKMWEWLDKIEIIFTEEVNADAIWGENGTERTAIHEKFKFD
jgi:hypothetical protein